MKQSDQRGVVGRFSKLTDGTDSADYQLIAQSFRTRLDCFSWMGVDGWGPAEFPKSGRLLWCFDGEKRAPTWVEGHPLSDPEKTLRAANDAYNKALVDGDVVALDRIFATEFTYTSTSGEVVSRVAQIQLFKSNTLDIVSAAGSEETVQIHGKTGIVIGRFDATGSYASKPFDSTERYTSVWVVRDDRWQLVAEQGTLVREIAGAK